MYAFFENNLAMYECLEWKLEMERQRSAVAEFITTEVIDVEQVGVFLMGPHHQASEFSQLVKKNVMKIVRCEQEEEHRFSCLAVEASTHFFEADFHQQMDRATLNDVLTQLGTSLELTFVNQSQNTSSERHNWRFMSTVRNALDQVIQGYGLEKERIRINLLDSTLELNDGVFSISSVELPMTHFVSEQEDFVRFAIVENMLPFVPVNLWRPILGGGRGAI